MTHARGCVLTAVAGVIATVMGGCPAPTPDPNRTFPVNVAPTLMAETVVSNANVPVALTFTPDGRLFYGEKNTGFIRVVVADQLLSVAVAQVPVNYAGDRGILSLAVHPAFNELPRLYASYSLSDTGAATNDPAAIIDNRVVYFTLDGNFALDEVFVASLPAGPGTTRVGGCIALDRNFYLWVATGDQTDAASTLTTNNLYGKMLRYNDDGTIPADNPDPSSPVVARGFRDPKGISIDPLTGDPFVLDQNANGFNELNRVRINRDFGWPGVIGFAEAANERAFALATPGYTDPLFETIREITTVAGGAFNPGNQLGPRRDRQFFFGSPTTRRVYASRLNGERSASGAPEGVAGPFPRPITDVAFSPTGTLYVATENAIYRVTPLN
jgi:glucose/arabinose dehydrogenase